MYRDTGVVLCVIDRQTTCRLLRQVEEVARRPRLETAACVPRRQAGKQHAGTVPRLVPLLRATVPARSGVSAASALEITLSTLPIDAA